MQVMAEDSSLDVGSRFDLAQSATIVNISLINVNDEYPQFVNAPYEVSLMEHSNISSLVVMVM